MVEQNQLSEERQKLYSQYKDQLYNVKQSIQDALNQEGFKEVKAKAYPEIKISKKDIESWFMVKVEGEIKGSIYAIVNWYEQLENRKKLDKKITEVKLIDQFDEDTKVIQNNLEGIKMIISTRDLLFAEIKEFGENDIKYFQWSVEHPLCPVNPNVVRMDMKFRMMSFEQINPQQSKFVSIAYVLPGGWVTKMTAEMLLSVIAPSFQLLKDLIEKQA